MAKKEIKIREEYDGPPGEVQLNIAIPKYDRDRIRRRAKEDKEPINVWVLSAIREKLDNEDKMNELQQLIVSTITSELSNLGSTDQLQKLAEQIEATIDFVRTETLGVEQSLEIKMLKRMLDLACLIGTSYDLPSTGFDAIALERLLESRRVSRKENGLFFLENPDLWLGNQEI